MSQRKFSIQNEGNVVVLPIPSDFHATNDSLSSKSLALSDFTSLNALSFVKRKKKSIGSSFRAFTSNDRKKQRKHLRLLNERLSEKIKNQEEPEPESISALKAILAKIRNENPSEYNTQASPDGNVFKRRAELTPTDTHIEIKPVLYSSCVCKNDSKKRISWDIFVIILVLWNVFAVPLSISFEQQWDSLEIQIVNQIANVAFLIDIVFNFYTSVMDKEGEEVFSRKQIAKQYIRNGTFILDLLAILPVDRVPSLYYLRVFGLLKLTRIYRLPKITRRFNLTDSTRTLVKIVNVTIMLLLIYHTTACLWCFVILKHKVWIPPINWINIYAFDFYSETPIKQYLVAQYYAQIGLNSGQIGPRDEIEYVVAACIIFVGMFINALIFGTMSQLLFSLRKNSIEEQRVIDMANTVMQKMKLPGKKRIKVLRYLRSIKSTHELQIQLTWFQKEISPTLVNQVRKHIYTEMLKKSELLQKILVNDDSEENINYLVSQFETQLSEPQFEIIKYGDKSSCMYFLAKGRAQVLWKDCSRLKFKPLTYLEEGAHFGEVGLIYNCNRTMTVMTQKYSTLAKLSGEKFNTFNFNYEDIFKPQIWDYCDRYKRNLETVLPRLPLFSGLTKDELHRVIFQFETKFFKNQQHLFQEGEKAEGLYVLQSGFVSLSFQSEGIQVPLKTLKRGSVLGYDSIISPNTHELNATCFNYYMIEDNLSNEFPLIRASKSKFRTREIPDFQDFNSDEQKDSPTTSNNGTEVCTTERYLMESGRKIVHEEKALQKKRRPSKFRGSSLREKLTELKTPMSLFRKCTNPTRELIKFKYENVGQVVEYNTVLSFLSIEKFKALQEEIPKLQQNKLTELINMNSNMLRPYILDYYVPLKWEFLDYSGKRNALYKFRNAVLHTLRSLRMQRKTMTVFDRVHDLIINEEMAGSREEQKLNTSRFDEFTTYTNMSMMSAFHHPKQELRSNSMQLVNQQLRRAESIANEQSGRFKKLMRRLDFLEYVIQEDQTPIRPNYRHYLTTKRLTTITDRGISHSEIETPSRRFSVNSDREIEDFIQMYESVMKLN